MTHSQWILLILGLVGSSLYSGLETGVVSVNRLRLQHLIRAGSRAADRIQRYVKDPDRLLGTTLAGTNLCNVLFSIISARLAVEWLGTGHGLWVASVMTTLVLLVFGEYLPKAWFRSYPAYRVLPFARFLDISAMIFYPISAGIMHLARLVIPGTALDTHSNLPFVTREELQFLTREGEKTGELTTSERRMMQGVLALTQKTCADIMIPRAEMIFCRPHTPAPMVLDMARKHGISRLPVYDDQARKFTGLVNTMDLLLIGDIAERKAQDVARPPQYVAASTRLDQIVPRMRMSHQPLALVMDQNELVVGLISIEDVMEEIVGDMQPA